MQKLESFNVAKEKAEIDQRKAEEKTLLEVVATIPDTVAEKTSDFPTHQNTLKSYSIN